MKDKTKWAKSLTDKYLDDVVSRWPWTIAEMQAGLSAAKYEQRRRKKKAEPVTGFSAKGCADKLDGREPTSGH